MLKLELIKKTDYDYTFRDNDNKNYKLNIIFYDLKEEPKIGDIFYMPESYIKEINIYNFGPVTNSDPNVSEEDIIKVISGKNAYYLQRYYG